MTTTPLTDQQLRDQAAEALMAWAESNNTPGHAPFRRPETVTRNAYSRADAVLAVVQPELDRLRAEQATARAAAFSEAAALISSTSLARLEEIDEDDQRPSHWERHGEWCEAAALLLAARTAQAPR